MTAPSWNLRIGNSEREDAVARLQSAASDGRITLDELDERVGQALAARTVGDLDTVLGDLGGASNLLAVASGQVAVPAVATSIDRGPGWSWDEPLELHAKWDSVKRIGVWEIPPFLEVDCRVEDVVLDCIDARPLSPVIDLQLTGGAGKVVVIVPPTWGADLSRIKRGLGGLHSNVPLVPQAGGVQIIVRGSCPLDGVRVRVPNRFDTWRLERVRKRGGVLLKG